MNDGSQSALTDSDPVLGAGNFNASIQLGSLLPTSTGVTITNITGYSDGANSDESGNPVCEFHAEFTYTANKANTVQGATATMLLLGGNVDNKLGGSTASLGASPFDPGAFFVPANPSGAGTTRSSPRSKQQWRHIGDSVRLDLHARPIDVRERLPAGRRAPLDQLRRIDPLPRPQQPKHKREPASPAASRSA